MNKIKFGIVGYGNIGKRHAQHIQANSKAELCAICDIEAIKINDLAIPAYLDLTTMLQEQHLDVLNVCTPNYLHAEHSILGLEKGLNIVCEKPMANSVADAALMINASKKFNKNIFVVKQNRFNPPVQAVKQLILNNKLGAIYFVNVNCYWNRNELYYQESSWRGDKVKDGGCLYTQFSHFIDIIYYLFGEMDALSTHLKNYQHDYTTVEDTGTCTLALKSGGLVNINFSTCAHEKNMEGSITIIAQNGTIKIGGEYLNTIAYQNIKNFVLPTIEIKNKNNEYGNYQGSMSNHDKIIENVINTLQGTETIMTNAQEGEAVVKIISDIYALAK